MSMIVAVYLCALVCTCVSSDSAVIVLTVIAVVLGAALLLVVCRCVHTIRAFVFTIK